MSILESLNSEIKQKKIPLQKWKELVDKTQISKIEINKIILKQLVFEGNLQAVNDFITESGEEGVSINIQLLTVRDKIRKAILGLNIDEAMGLINDIDFEILELNDELHFKLLQLKFIRLVAEKKLKEAIKLSQNNIFHIAAKRSDIYKDFEDMSILLLYDDIEKSPYKDYLTEGYIKKILFEINYQIMKNQRECFDDSHGIYREYGGIDVLLKNMKWNCSIISSDMSFPYISSYSPFEYKADL